MATWALPKRLFARGFFKHVLFAVFAVVLLLCGVELRHWTWDKTRHVRYQHDIVNGFYWGSETLKEARNLSPDDHSANSWSAFFQGYLALYDRVKDEAYESDYGLDYPPLRLLVMSIWAKQVRSDFQGVDDGHPSHIKPLLNINLFCELLSALGIFLLVNSCVKRASASEWRGLLGRIPAEHRAWIYGLAAASVAWLEPSTILDAHGWPQWDIWIVPFYLFAVLAGLKNRWFLCGCLLAVGAMLKGQLLFVAPFFVFWPLWQKDWTGAARLLAGFAAASALVVSPWLLRNPQAWISVALVGLASFAILAWRDVRYTGAWVAAVVAVATFLTGVFLGGSFAWLRIGFVYGSEHYPYLFISSCYNLPSLLDSLGWSLKEPLWSYEFGSRYIAVTPQWTLRLLYFGSLALCALGAARHTRTRDPRLLIAIATPWLLMFALLGQMHERYLIWGAIISAVALGVSVRLSTLHFIISIVSSAMIVHVMLIDKKLDSTSGLIDLLHDVRPYASILLLVCVGVYLWDMLSTPVALFQPDSRRASAKPASALSLGPELEEA
jgi:hypothetical protein